MTVENTNRFRSLTGNTFDAFELAWDTRYFNVHSAKTVLKDSVSEKDHNILKNFMNAFEFVTIINSGNNVNNNIWVGRETDAFLTDMNVLFDKRLSSPPESIDDMTQVLNSYPQDELVLDIARRAFKHSRFFNDPWLPVDKVKDIYLNWTKNAFNRPDRFFASTKRGGKVAGFLLFSINTETLSATIELIAVDDNYKGQNVGKSLVAAMEAALLTDGITLINVGTQSDNIPAVRFYESCGFKYIGCDSVYHYWPNKKMIVK